MQKYTNLQYIKNTNLCNLFLQIVPIIFILLIGLPTVVNAAKVDDFIPNDSFVYLKLQDFDEIYNEISTSNTWKNALDGMMSELEIQEMKNRLAAAQSIIGTDVYGIIDTIGYQTGLALWTDDTNAVNSGLVVHSGGNLQELQRLTKLITGAIGLTGGTLTLDAGKYNKVKYNTLQLAEAHLTYGFVGDLLVVGQDKNSFEKLIDTYRKKSASIKSNKTYTKISKRLQSAQFTIFVNVPQALPHIDDIDDTARTQLKTFNHVYAKLNLLEAAPLFQIYTEFNDLQPESKISPFLEEIDELKILKNMSGKEDLFVAAAPSVLANVWQLIQQEIQNTETDDAIAFITFLEGILNLDFEEDVIAALTGEIALSVDNLSLFEPSALESLDVNLENSIQVDAGNVHTHGGLLYISSNPDKWDQIGNSLSNLQNSSISSFDYKGNKVSVFGSNIYYAERDGLSLLSFSEDQMYSLVDRIAEKKEIANSKHLPKSPLVFVNLNIVKLLQVFQDNFHLEFDEKKQDEIFPLLAWITVDKNVAMLEVRISSKESPLQVLAKLANIIISNMQF